MPACADGLVDQSGKFWIGEHQPAARCNAISFVGETFWKRLVVVMQSSFFQQLRMQFRNAIDRFAANNCKMRHLHAALTVLSDDAHTAHPRVVVGKASAHIIQKPAINLKDDLEMPRQQTREHVQWPTLQCLGQKRVVGVSKGGLRHPPRILPSHLVLIHQQTHQLRNANRRMRIVQLHSPFLVELCKRFPQRQVQPHHVLQRARRKEELLCQPQALAFDLLVRRIQHFADGLGFHLGAHGTGIIAAVEDA